MKKLRRIICAVFGHQHEEIQRTEDYIFCRCKRCEQTLWFHVLKGQVCDMGIWNRALTDEEMQMLKESSLLTYAEILEGK